MLLRFLKWLASLRRPVQYGYVLSDFQEFFFRNPDIAKGIKDVTLLLAGRHLSDGQYVPVTKVHHIVGLGSLESRFILETKVRTIPSNAMVFAPSADDFEETFKGGKGTDAEAKAFMSLATAFQDVLGVFIFYGWDKDLLPTIESLVAQSSLPEGSPGVTDRVLLEFGPLLSLLRQVAECGNDQLIHEISTFLDQYMERKYTPPPLYVVENGHDFTPEESRLFCLATYRFVKIIDVADKYTVYIVGKLLSAV